MGVFHFRYCQSNSSCATASRIGPTICPRECYRTTIPLKPFTLLPERQPCRHITTGPSLASLSGEFLPSSLGLAPLQSLRHRLTCNLFNHLFRLRDGGFQL